MELLNQLNSRLRLVCEEYKNNSKPVILRRSQEIYDYLENQFQNQIGLRNLAEHLKLSHSRTAHLVKEVCGKNFVTLLNEIRIKKAFVYLKNTDLLISEVALKVGFGELSHFHHVFKKLSGFTPRSFRFSS